MRLVVKAILFLSTGYLPVAFAFLRLQAITGDDVEKGCSQEQLSHLIESVKEAGEAAHNTGSTLQSAGHHSFPAFEILLGGQHYDDPSTKDTFAAAVTTHVVNLGIVLSKTLATATQVSSHNDTLNFACPLKQEQPIVVKNGPSGIRNVLHIGPNFFKMSSKTKADQNAYDAAKKKSKNWKLFAQMPAFRSAAFHILRIIPEVESDLFHSLPVPATPLSLDRLAGSSLEADGYASVCILKQLDEEPFVPCDPFASEIMSMLCPSMAGGNLTIRKARMRRSPGNDKPSRSDQPYTGPRTFVPHRTGTMYGPRPDYHPTGVMAGSTQFAEGAGSAAPPPPPPPRPPPINLHSRPPFYALPPPAKPAKARQSSLLSPFRSSPNLREQAAPPAAPPAVPPRGMGDLFDDQGNLKKEYKTPKPVGRSGGHRTRRKGRSIRDPE